MRLQTKTKPTYAGEAVTLRPITMITPTRACVYHISSFKPPLTIPYDEFIARFADNSQLGIVWDGDRGVQTKIFGDKDDCWYIL